MPVVPTYDLPQVAPGALPSARFDAPQMPDVSGKQMQAAGEAALKTGSTFKAIADRIQADKDDAATKEMDNKLAEAYRGILHDKEAGYLNSVGKAAVDGRDATAEALRKAREQVERGITDDFQRVMFKNVADRRTESAMLQVDVHAGRQTKIWHEGESVARVKGLASDALANSTTWNMRDESGAAVGPYAQAKKAMLAEVDSLAQLRGYDTAQTEQLRAESLAGLHGAVLNNMVSLGQSKMARDYLEAAAPDLAKGAPDKLDNLRNLVKTAGVKDEAANLASSLKGGLQQQISQLEAMRSSEKISVEVYDNARQRVEHNWQLKKTMENEGNKSMAGAFQDWSLKNQGKAFADAPTHLYNWAKSQGKLDDFYNFHNRGGQPADRRVELKVRGELLNMATTDPDKFIAEFKENGFLGRMDLGANGIKEMQSIATDMVSGSGRYRVSVDEKILKDAIPSALQNAKTKEEKEQRDRFVALQHEAVINWQKANPGKRPTLEEQRQIANSANSEYLAFQKWYEFGETKVPAYRLKPMPDDFRQQAAAELKRRGLPATPDAITSLWAKQKESR